MQKRRTMNILNNSPRAKAARELSKKISLFHRESTARIIMWIEAEDRTTFRPKEVEDGIEDFDYRSIGAALQSLTQCGFLNRGEKVKADKRASIYRVNRTEIKKIKSIIEPFI